MYRILIDTYYKMDTGRGMNTYLVSQEDWDRAQTAGMILARELEHNIPYTLSPKTIHFEWEKPNYGQDPLIVHITLNLILVYPAGKEDKEHQLCSRVELLAENNQPVDLAIALLEVCKQNWQITAEDSTKSIELIALAEEVAKRFSQKAHSVKRRYFKQ